MRRRGSVLRLTAAGVAALGLVSGLLSACTGSHSEPPEHSVAREYLSAFAAADASAAGALTTDQATATSALTASLAGLGSGAKATLTLGQVTATSKTSATATYSAAWRLPGTTAKWTYNGSLPLVRSSATKTNQGWLVSWNVHDVQPGLSAGRHLTTQRVQPVRANLDDSSGRPLFAPTAVVFVSVNPARVKNPVTLARALAKTLKISAAGIVATIKATPKGQAAPIITLRRSAYLQVKAKIYSLPGTQFSTGTELLGPSSRFAQPLLGQVGPATKEIIDGSHGAVVAGDQTGLSGLQRALNPQLAGTPGVSVFASAAAAATGPTSPPATLIAAVSKPVVGRAVTLTLNRADQLAAEATLAKESKPAAIVVTQPSTGEVLAVANSAAATDDIALVGQYPPGSSFKIVTYTAAFTANPRLSPVNTAACPGSIVVNGQTVKNEHSFSKGTIPLSDAFAFSCNTTAARLGLALPAKALVSAASSLGLGQDWSSLPVSAFSGSLPEPTSVNEAAADAYGQGTVLVSPLLMAEIAGAAATGRSVVPSLIAGHAGTRGSVQPARVTGYLNTIMRDVVTVPRATGHALDALPGHVQGKTGTADFGTGNPPKAHSWFAGTRGTGAGRISYSVFIYGGGSSVTGAVPLAKTLLTALP